ncbi:TetR/AcrR family transcriptional regulator [Xanthobacter autotrophicus DSM 431]|uniref:TetR/AcrR family transcriptional regulator n=1 Tax=Xanthobacter nonsaccharivorans TaxID=3119912 RepID=UPI003727F0B9
MTDARTSTVSTAPAADVAAAPAEAAARPDHRAGQRQRILAAALACFARDGFHGASMQKICTEAGMSPGALYRYFPSKESIIAAIAEGERAERLAFFDAVAKAPSVITALTDCTRAMLEDGCLATARLGPEIMAEAIRNQDLRAAMEPHEAESRQQLRAALEKAVAQGEIDPALDLDMVVVMLQIIGDGVILHHHLHPEWNIAARLSSFATLVRRMLAPEAPQARPAGEA